MSLTSPSPRSGVLIAASLALIASACSAPAPSGNPAHVSAFDVAGHAVDPLEAGQATAVVLVFVRTDCPVSNRYAPELRRLYERFHGRGVAFWLVYPDPATTAAEIESHRAEYDVPIPGLRDPDHVLVKRAGASITPEAAVFRPGKERVYLGRIDDRFVDFGRTRPEPTTHDLEQALDAVLSGKPAPTPRGEPVGCYIADLG